MHPKPNLISVWIVFTLNIACNVRRCKSVNTRRGFFGDDKCSAMIGSSSFRLHPLNGMSEIKTEKKKRESKIPWMKEYSS